MRVFMEKKFIITQTQLETAFAMISRSDCIIEGLKVGDYVGFLQALQNLPEFQVEEQSVEVE